MIQGTGAFLPGDPITNEALTALFGRRGRRLCEAIGVERRHWALDPGSGWRRTGLRNSEMAARAAATALENAGRSAAEVDLLVLVTATPDHPFPATVTLVQDILGIQECVALELRAACAGVPQAFAVADLFLRAGKASAALVIGAELSSCFIDLVRAGAESPSDDILLSAVMFGDGAGAALLSAEEATGERDGVFATTLNSMGVGKPPGFVCEIGGSRSPFLTLDDAGAARLSHDFRGILELGPTMVLRAFDALRASTALGQDDFALIVPPQANPALTARIVSSCGVDATRVFSNADRVGNTSSASLLIALDELNRTGRVRPGDRVALLGAEASKWLYGAVALTWTRPAMKGA